MRKPRSGARSGPCWRPGAPQGAVGTTSLCPLGQVARFRGGWMLSLAGVTLCSRTPASTVGRSRPPGKEERRLMTTITHSLSAASLPRGRALLRDPRFNRGTAFTAKERAALGLEGLLPAAVASLEDQ